MGLFERLNRVVRAEINYNSKNPEGVVNNCIKEMEATIAQLRQSIIQTTAAKKRTEEKYHYHLSQTYRWQQRAELALAAGDENLAREALIRKRYFEGNVAELKAQTNLDNSTVIIAHLQQKLTFLEIELADYKMLQASYYKSKVQRQLQETIGGIDTSSAMSAFESMEDKVMQIEAESQSAAELNSIILERQLAQLDANSDTDDELAALKALLSSSSDNLDSSPTNTPKDSHLDAELEELRAQLNDS